VKKRSFVFVNLVCLLLHSIFVIAQAPAPATTPEILKNEIDLIHSGDVIDVDFAGGLEYDWRGTLASDGMLDGVNEFSPILALCRSETDVARDIERAYSKVLREPKVTVRIVDRSDRPLARLEGAVKTPTRFRILRAVRLRELIVAAGGFTDNASGEVVILRRGDQNCVHQAANGGARVEAKTQGQADNGLQRLNILVAELLSGKEFADPLILGGDVVSVEKAVPVYVIGAVSNPKPQNWQSGMTLTRAIATAGGLIKASDGHKVTVYRRVKADTTVMQFDLEKIKSGEIDDVELRAFDIIEVAFKGRAPSQYPPVIAARDGRPDNGSVFPLRVID